jgi:hypothetical protein
MKEMTALLSLAVVLVSGTALAAGVGLDPADWRIFFSKNLPNHPSGNGAGGWQFELRDNREVHYVLRGITDEVRGAVSDGGSYLEVSMNIECPNSCSFKATQGYTPAAITVMIRKTHDDALTDANGRFWCGSGRITLAQGTHTVTCPLKRSAWTNVDGQRPSFEAWNNMLNNLGEVGVTFGGTFYGHGVRMSNGSAVVSMLKFDVI